MAAVSVETIRSRVAEAVAAIGAGDEWVEVSLAWDVADGTSNQRHKHYAVGVPRSVAMSDRQRPGQSAFTTSTITVRSWFRLKPKQSVATYDLSLTAEAAVRVAVCARTPTYPGDCTIRWVDTNRTVLGDEWHRCDLTFQVVHQQEN